MQVPSGWPRIFFVIYRRRKSVAKRRVQGGSAKEGRTARSKWEKREQPWGDGRAKWDGRLVRDSEEGREGDRKSFTVGPASSLRSLQKGTIMRIHWGKDSRPFPRMYIVKMQASAHSRKREAARRLAGKQVFHAL